MMGNIWQMRNPCGARVAGTSDYGRDYGTNGSVAPPPKKIEDPATSLKSECSYIFFRKLMSLLFQRFNYCVSGEIIVIKS